jgi:1-acyl-sn-glycerol-3-phosphate acyltransferase
MSNFMPASYLWALLVKDPLIILATIAFGTVSVCVSFFDPAGRMTDRIARAWARLLLRIAGVRLRLEGLERIDPSGTHLFAGNHLSLFDTPVVLSSIPSRFLFLVNARYVRLPFLGTHLRRTGHFSVDPGDTRASLRILTAAARAVRERKLSILVFPEGTRSRDGRVGEFREGAAYLAIKAGIPVIPFAIHGTREVLPTGSVHVRGGIVKVVFGAPVDTAAYTVKDRAALNDLLREKVASMAARLANEASGRG